MNKPLRGFKTVLLKLQCGQSDAAESLKNEYKNLLSIANGIDQKIKDGSRALAFPAFALQFSANILVKKLRIIAETTNKNLLPEKPLEVIDRILTKSKRLAYQSYAYAINENPDLDEKTDNEVYDWLKEHGCDVYDKNKLPNLGAWKRYVRYFRKANGTQKYNSRKGRIGRSTVKVDQIEYNSSQRPN